MAGPRITVTVPNFAAGLRKEQARLERNLKRAALEATDLASKKAQREVQARMKRAGLGKLANAVGHTSAKKKRQTDRTPYGVIYARGGDNSRAGNALESYTVGATIRAFRKKWLAFPTDAIPKRVGRRKMTPELYNRSGLVQSIGALSFRPLGPNRALLMIKPVSLSPKTGRAKRLGPGKTRTRVVPPRKQVAAFVLIKETRRAARFDQKAVMQRYSGRVPDYMSRLIRQYQRNAS